MLTALRHLLRRGDDRRHAHAHRHDQQLVRRHLHEREQAHGRDREADRDGRGLARRGAARVRRSLLAKVRAVDGVRRGRRLDLRSAIAILDENGKRIGPQGPPHIAPGGSPASLQPWTYTQGRRATSARRDGDRQVSPPRRRATSSASGSRVAGQGGGEGVPHRRHRRASARRPARRREHRSVHARRRPSG